MDWFENITGFRELGYEATRERLAVEGHELVSRVNGRRFGIGRFELVDLQSLRERSADDGGAPRCSVECIAGDARALHLGAGLEGALFQVASQFNLLEMVSPEVSPEQGVTRYVHDRTQGPACAIAAGAATIYRNYFVPVDGEPGQTAARQIDALQALGESLAAQAGLPVSALWTMRNGYALGKAEGLRAATALLQAASDEALDALRGRLAIGLHHGAEVTDAPGPARPTVSQAFCSALPVAYTGIPPAAWVPLAPLVLEAAYEATLLAAVEQRRRGGSATVLLTRLGGGVFGNEDAWIDAAIERALKRVEHGGLAVKLVSFGSVHPAMRAIARRWAGGAA